MIVTISIRLPEKIKGQIEAIADETDRTKSKTYELLLLKGIEQYNLNQHLILKKI